MVDLNSCYRKIDECKCVSFDIFDTLISRPFVHPTDLFLLIEKKYNVEKFSLHRILAEKLAYEHSLNEEITIDDIYSMMHPEYCKFKEIEKKLEISLCRANPFVKKIYDYALSKNKIISITSDIYLDKDTITTILAKNGYANFNLFLSSDYKVKKESGNLYYYLQTRLNLKPQDILHIGDNRFSDYNVPKTIGFNTYLIQKNVEILFDEMPLLKKFYLKNKNNVDVSIIIGIISYLYSSQPNNSFWYNFGLIYAGPVVSQFSEWLSSQLKDEKVDTIAFIARDGYNLKLAFDYITNNHFKTEYIYANRKLKLLFDLDFSKYAMWPDVYASAIDSALEFYNSELHFLTKDLSNYSLSEKMRIYEINKSAIETLSKKYLSQYINYLESKLLGKNIAMVDSKTVNFSSQSLLSAYTLKNIRGYYYFRELFPFKSIDYFGNFAYTTYHKDFENGYLNWDLMEFILSSPEQSLKSFKDDKFIFNNSENDVYRSSIYPEVSNGSFAFSKCFHDIFVGCEYIVSADSIASFINYYCINMHKTSDAKYFKMISHQVFDTNYYRPMFGSKDMIIRLKLICKRMIRFCNKVSLRLLNKKIFYKKYKNGVTYYCFLFFPLLSKRVVFL